MPLPATCRSRLAGNSFTTKSLQPSRTNNPFTRATRQDGGGIRGCVTLWPSGQLVHAAAPCINFSVTASQEKKKHRRTTRWLNSCVPHHTNVSMKGFRLRLNPLTHPLFREQQGNSSEKATRGLIAHEICKPFLGVKLQNATLRGLLGRHLTKIGGQKWHVLIHRLPASAPPFHPPARITSPPDMRVTRLMHKESLPNYSH